MFIWMRKAFCLLNRLYYLDFATAMFRNKSSNSQGEKFFKFTESISHRHDVLVTHIFLRKQGQETNSQGLLYFLETLMQKVS